MFNKIMKKCPYCFEDLTEKPLKCPHCNQYIIDDLPEVDFHGSNKKPCIFCGKKIRSEAIFCRYCKRWLDEVEKGVNDLKSMED